MHNALMPLVAGRRHTGCWCGVRVQHPRSLVGAPGGQETGHSGKPSLLLLLHDRLGAGLITEFSVTVGYAGGRGADNSPFPPVPCHCAALLARFQRAESPTTSIHFLLPILHFNT